jgi:hypothetical protein
MKPSFLLICIISWDSLSAQRNIPGHYENFDGCAIDIYPDSTFHFSWHFDMEGSWTKGSWGCDKDTIILIMIPIYDTVTYPTRNNGSADSIILSLDTVAERISPEPSNVLYTGGQNRYPCPTRLLFRKNRLYYLSEDSKVAVSWERPFGLRRGKKYPNWFVRRNH